MNTPSSSRSQVSYEAEDSNLECGVESLSIGMLIKQSLEALNSECNNLEKEIEEKTNMIKHYKEVCTRQAENISKQQLEFEHSKVKTHSEQTNIEYGLMKISKMMEKSHILERYFVDWFKSINLTMPSKEELEQFFENLSIKNKQEAAACSQLEQKYKDALESARHVYNELDMVREREQNEFDEVKTHLMDQLQPQSTDALDEQLLVLKSDCREKSIINEIVSSQNNELENSVKSLQNELTTEIKSMESIKEQLQNLLHEELMKKESYLANIEATDKSICESHNNLREKEMEIKLLSSKQKKLILEEEESTKVYKAELEALNDLQSNTELKKEQFSTLFEISESNISLNVKCEDLEQILVDYEEKIANVENDGLSYINELEKLKNTIKELESESSNILIERLNIENKIKELQEETNHILIESKQFSIEIDQPYDDLTRDEDLLTNSLNALTKELSKDSKGSEEFEKIIKNLEVELKRAKEISQQNDFKLISHNEESKFIENDLKEQDFMLDNTLEICQQELNKARTDENMNEELKENVKKLEIELETQQKSINESLNQLQEFHGNQIEIKNRLPEDLRIQKEREFRNKEQSKTDAVVELKEMKARIVDLDQQTGVLEVEVQKIQNNVERGKNLLVKYGSKLNLAHIATTHNQTLAVSTTRQPDEINQMKMKRVFKEPDKRTMKNTTIPKKGNQVLSAKKQSSDLDVWGFSD